jgi:formate hydrogenlyase subunit 4
MKSRQQKWAILAAAGSISGILMLLLFRSIPMAAGTAAGVIVTMIVIKHVALAMIVGSPLAAIFKSIKPKLRSHCPFAKP